MPPPTFAELVRFCEIDGWEERKSARGKTGDHVRFKKTLPDGRILLTTASRSKAQIGKSLWAHIWRDQLALESEAQFWDALCTGRPVERGGRLAGPVKPTLPGWLVARLLGEVGLAEAELRDLTEEEGLRRLHEHWSRPPDEEP